MVESPPFGRLAKGICPRLSIPRHTQVKQIISFGAKAECGLVALLFLLAMFIINFIFKDQ